MHKMTKATSIPKSVKEAVYERDGGHCILCGRNNGEPVAHVIRRSQGGRGIEQNIVTLCPSCHRAFDEGPQRTALYACIVGYLKAKYPGWTRENMIYRKNMEELK